MDEIPDIDEENIPNLWWSLEGIGIHDDPGQLDDEVALNQFNSTIEFKDGRYTVDFPWKGTESSLPSNYGLALGRLKNLVTNKLKPDDDLMNRYDEVIKDQLNKGVIEMVTADSEEGPIKHYLAHHAVITPTKTTTKIRLVYDASARINKKHPSLNDVIHQGPLLLPHLIGLLLRFRQRKIGIVGDLEKAFLQISLHTKARDATRFLWLRDPWDKRKKVEDNIQVFRFTRVPFGVNASPFLLAATVEKHLKDTNTDVAHLIRENVYVDNVIVSVDTDNQALQLYKEGKIIFNAANMNLREWLTNSNDVMTEIPQEDHAKSTTAKILGMPWNSETDTMGFVTPDAPSDLLTKRKTVKFVASLYDPLGLLIPMTLEGKLLIQSLWKLKMAWDDELPDPKRKELHSLIENYSSVSSVKIPRCAVSLGDVKSHQLHTFVDASQQAYACCTYLRSKHENGSIKCTLLFAKNRLAPTSTAITIPKMETLALLIGTRAQVILEKELRIPVEKRVIWSDSQCTLHWLTSTNRQPVFIENRMKEIRKNASNTSFKYVKSEENPADFATKPGNGKDLGTNTAWWNGPEWLHLKEEEWPVWIYDTRNLLMDKESDDRSEETVCQSAIHMTTARVVEPTQSQFPVKIERFSSLTKLHRVTALVLRYVDRRIWSRLSDATRDSHMVLKDILRHSYTRGPIQAIEIKKAGLIWIKTVQHECYKHELTGLTTSSPGIKLQRNLNLQIDTEGILRSEGRLAHSNPIHFETNSPRLLPNNHHYTNLMIKDVHQRLLHAGVQQTLSTIRLAYWIPKGRQVVKRILQTCVTCKRIAGGPYRFPSLPSLPQERVNICKPFAHTGLDYMGPITYRNGKQQHKGWICLMTCFATRAIHMELLSDMTTEQFLLALRRFIARRGCPETILTDNAPQFVKAAKVVQWERQLTDDSVQNYCSNQGIQWQFNTPLAPWSGGVYERMIGIIKPALRKALGRKIPQQDELFTLLTEVEAVVNCRPLTYVYSDQESTMIRPIDLITPRSLMPGTPQLAEDQDDDEYVPVWNSANQLIHHWAKSQTILEKFWNLWVSEYLCSLRERFSKGHPNPKVTSTQSIQPGDVVVIRDDSLPRGSWRLGQIVEVQEGRDEAVRSATVAQHNGNLLNRPISHLYPLEIEQAQHADTDSTSQIKQTCVHTHRIESFKAPEHRKHLHKPTYTNKMSTVKSLLLLILFGLIPTVIETKQCPPNTKMVPIDSQSCVQQGIVVYRQYNDVMCHLDITCPDSLMLFAGSCSSQCATTCPEWATGCSYHEDIPVKPTIDVTEELNKLKSHVCSFSESPACDPEPMIQTLHTIQLQNKSIHYVHRLRISVEDPTEDQYSCFGEGPVTGSPAFCQNHECISDGTQFCYYKSPEIVFLQTDNGKIPIRAWGTQEVVTYPFKDSAKEEAKCINCNVDCVTGGIKLTIDPGVAMAEICSKPYCYTINAPNMTEVVRFPAEVNLHMHDFQVKIWKRGFLVKNVGRQCPSQPFCEDIQCRYCLIRLKNPQCTPAFFLTMVFVILYLCLMCGHWNHARNAVEREEYAPFYTLTRVKKPSEPTREDKVHKLKSYTKGTPSKTTKVKKPVSSSILLVILALVAGVNSCSLCITLNAPQSVCSVDETGKQECVLTEVTRISLMPQGQDSCLLIRDPVGTPIGTLSIEVDKIGLSCDAENLFFTRGFKMESEAVKRCSGAGSCWTNKCGAYNIYSKISELGKSVNQRPGYTFCTQSSGCGASGCFYCTSACLFYRIYATPRSNKVYEAFRCPTWSYKIQVTARQTVQGQQTSHTFTLKPGVEEKWNAIKMSLVSVTNPPVPLLADTFLTDGQRTLMVGVSNPGQPVVGTVGEFQCKNFQTAKDFNGCIFPQHICTCNPQDTDVSCACHELNIEKLFQESEKIIPFQSQAVNIFGQGKDIFAEFNSYAALELQVSMEGVRMATQVDKNKCYVSVSAFGRCYSCITGAKVQFECKTNFGEALAHVQCGQAFFSTPCTPEGIKATASMMFKMARIQETCTVRCPAGETTVELDGNLVFIDKERVDEINNMIVGKDLPGEVDLGFIGAWLSGHWMLGITIFIVVTIFFIASLFIIPLTCHYIFNRFVTRRAKTTINNAKPTPQPSSQNPLEMRKNSTRKRK